MCDALLTPQPPPVPATGDLWEEFIADAERVIPDAVLADMRARQVRRFERHGAPLQLGAGHDFNASCYRKALDAAVDAWGEARSWPKDSREAVWWADVAYTFAELAGRVRGGP
jgi:hypothetical protein